MQVLWAPWRMAYVGVAQPPGCIFCNAATTADRRAALVLAQRPVLVLLNRFPYSSGHLMVAPVQHHGDFTTLPADAARVLGDVLQRSAALLREAFTPQGLNIGMNQGAAGGAGIVDHLHWHLVPRWVGDTNFMPMLAETRVIPEHLAATYERLAPLFAPLETL